MSNSSTVHIEDIKSFTKNNKHAGDYFLVTDQDLTFWVKDPNDLLKAERSSIVSLDATYGVEVMANGKKGQYIELVHVEFENSFASAIPKDSKPFVAKEEYEARPDYAGWTDEAIAMDILERKKEKERREGNSFVKFRKKVVDSQGERHKALLKSLKHAKKYRTVPEFEDIEIDEDYMRTLTKEQRTLEMKLGKEVMIGDGLGRLDGSPNYDGNKDISWGTPDRI